MNLATLFNDGWRVAVLQDEEQHDTIALRVRLIPDPARQFFAHEAQILGIYALDPETPLISLIYEVAASPEEMQTGKMASFMQTQLGGAEGAQTNCTSQALALVRRLLQLNSTKVVPEYEANLEPDQRNFQRSFIIPIGLLDTVQIGKVMYNPGCTVCGSVDAKNCSGCKIERYCSSG